MNAFEVYQLPYYPHDCHYSLVQVKTYTHSIPFSRHVMNSIAMIILFCFEGIFA